VKVVIMNERDTEAHATPISGGPLAAVKRPEISGALGSMNAPVRLRVTARRRLTDRLLELTLVRADGWMVRFEPGQFCNIAVPGPGGELWRSYSMATPTRSGESVSAFQIAVSAVEGGAATRYLFSRRAGDTLRACGPFGRLLLPRDDPAHYLLIGTGTGMAPYRAMLPELDARAVGQALRVTLLMGARTRAECLYGDEFREFVRADPARRRFLVCYSREPAPLDPDFERAGHVQQSVNDLDLSPAATRAFLCGNPDMIDAMAALLMAQGFDRRALVREKYQSRPSRR
jgi:ferredoxin-NADP reductase